MNITMEQYQETVQALQDKLGGFVPKVAIILGSGLDFDWTTVENTIFVPYGDIPHMPPSTAPGHVGRFAFGVLEGQPVAVMQGRHHYYEGYGFDQVTYGVRIMHLLGCETLVVTNAAGCVNTQWKAGDLMLIQDHIKLALDSPLRGKNMTEFGVRFPDCSTLYTPALQDIARAVAEEHQVLLRSGVYMYCSGPQYETPAEVRAARVLGATAVGMSTVPEVIVAGHCGMKVLGISLLTNMAAGILDQPLDEQEVLEAGRQAREKFSTLVRGCLARM